MGDLSVSVRLNGEVVEDRVVPVQRIVRLGDSADAVITFPGADVAVVRMGDKLALRGRTLEEGEGMDLALGPVQVRVEHTVRAAMPAEWSGLWDRRFLATALLVVAAGTWIDAAESWLDRQPTDAVVAVSRVHGLLADPGDEEGRQRAATIPAGHEVGVAPVLTEALPDGPRHVSDDRETRTGWAAWYRNEVPDDTDQAFEALDRLASDRNDVSAMRVLGRVAYEREDFDQAAAYYGRLSERFPADRDARLRLAWGEKRRGHHRIEAEHYTAILMDDPTHVGALSGLAVALARMNRLDESARRLEELQTLAPVASGTELTIASISALQGHDQRALEALDRAFAARAGLSEEMQLELRRDLALDPAFASLRKDPRLTSLVNRHLGAAGARPAR
jgi:hypothetical protein